MKEDLYFHGIKALVKNSENKVLLLKVDTSKRPNYSGDQYWDIPGGRVEKGRSIVDTLTREIFEEVGINKNIEIGGCLGILLSPIRIQLGMENYGLFLSVYECKFPDNAPIVISEEHVDYGWFDWVEAKKLLQVKYGNDFLEIIHI